MGADADPAALGPAIAAVTLMGEANGDAARTLIREGDPEEVALWLAAMVVATATLAAQASGWPPQAWWQEYAAQVQGAALRDLGPPPST